MSTTKDTDVPQVASYTIEFVQHVLRNFFLKDSTKYCQATSTHISNKDQTVTSTHNLTGKGILQKTQKTLG